MMGDDDAPTEALLGPFSSPSLPSSSSRPMVDAERLIDGDNARPSVGVLVVVCRPTEGSLNPGCSRVPGRGCMDNIVVFVVYSTIRVF